MELTLRERHFLELVGVAFFIYGLMVLTLELLGFIVTRLERWWDSRHGPQ